MRAATRRGTALPPALADAPVLWPGNEVFWDAFWMLSGRRQIAMGFGVITEQPISYEAIAAYARARPWLAPGTNGFDVLEQAVCAMDRVFITHMAERRTAEAEAKRRQQRPGGNAT